MEPYEIIAAPVTLFIAPVGEAFPAIDTDPPGGNWAKVGTSGDLNYDEDGFSISHEQNIATWRALGSTGRRKAWRDEEGLLFSFTLVDLSLEQYAHALNENAVAETSAGAGTAGFKEIPLHRGLTVVSRALLIRGVSAYDETMPAQYEIPVAVEGGSPEVVFQKSEPAGLALEWMALEDPNAASAANRFGRTVMQHEAAQ